MTSKYTGLVPLIKSKHAEPVQISLGAVQSSTNPAKQLLSALWSSPDEKFQIGALDRQTKKFRNIAVKSVDEADQLASKLSAEGHEAYFAIAGYETSDNRTTSNSSGAGGFWMDLDCGADKASAGKGYLTTQEAAQAILKFCNGIEIPAPTHVVDSGGGLHVYWVFDKFLHRDPWLAYAKKFKSLAQSHRLLADPTRTADIASVLRLPGTLNFKYTPPRPVTILHASDEPIATLTILNAIDKAYKCLLGVAGGPQKTRIDQPAMTSGKFSNNSTDYADNNWSVGRLAALLKHIDPEEGGRPAWIAIGMALHNVTGGSGEGLELFDQWSKPGGTYPDRRAIEVQWRSFNANSENRHNIGTIINRVKATKHDWMAICAEVDDPFEQCELEVVEPTQLPLDKPSTMVLQTSSTNPLERFSLRGMSESLSREIGQQIPILGGLALIGQSTFMYAEPGTGKTLLTIALLCEDIKAGRIEPTNLYYINVDDTAHGLVEKLSIAEEFGFHMLAENYNEFRAAEFLGILSEMIDKEQAQGIVIVLDTTKKFADLMDKKKTSSFMNVIRPFVVKGGTVIGMAHTNKNPGSNGKVVYGGTTDLRDDCDCCHTIEVVGTDGNEKTVGFNNIKSRGNVIKQATYRYSTEPTASYNEILLSVEEIDDDERAAVSQLASAKNDAEVVDCILRRIADGTATKMALASAVAGDAKISKRRVLGIIEKYTGDDPVQHKWQFSIREHGKKVYVPLTKVTLST